MNGKNPPALSPQRAPRLVALALVFAAGLAAGSLQRAHKPSAPVERPDLLEVYVPVQPANPGHVAHLKPTKVYDAEGTYYEAETDAAGPPYKVVLAFGARRVIYVCAPTKINP